MSIHSMAHLISLESPTGPHRVRQLFVRIPRANISRRLVLLLKIAPTSFRSFHITFNYKWVDDDMEMNFSSLLRPSPAYLSVAVWFFNEITQPNGTVWWRQERASCCCEHERRDKRELHLMLSHKIVYLCPSYLISINVTFNGSRLFIWFRFGSSVT